eukprot:m.197899 g.197899  ORF g.197899 m.197899 type:complete len:386 (+) comp17031_c0_seq3:12-1169(+)
MMAHVWSYVVLAALFEIAISQSFGKGNIPDYLLMQRYEVVNASQRGAVCNDGSPVAYYVRNCTANGDAKPGDPDFCAKGSIEGVARYQWFVIVDDDNQFCWDAASCGERPAKRKTAATNATIFPDGALSPYPEANPNFYKAAGVYIPSCSSDLFLGNSSQQGLEFRGANILTAVLQDLQSQTYFGHVRAPLATADDIIVSGGPGVVHQANHLRSLLPSHSNVIVVCDSCLWPKAKPLAGSITSLQAALTSALAQWQSPVVSSWDALSASSLLASSGSVAVVGPQVPSSYLTYQAAGVSPNNPGAQDYLEQRQQQVLSTLVDCNTTFVSRNQTALPAMLDHQFYYFTKLACANGYQITFDFALSAFISTVVNGADEGGYIRCNITA